MRYFFHLKDGDYLPDEDGLELRSIEEAKDAATQLLVETLKANSCKLWATNSLQVVVADQAGLTMFSLDLSATLAPILMRGGAELVAD